MASNETVFDKVIVGGGIAGLAAAYEILRLAQEKGKPCKLALLTDKIHAPTSAGTNLVLGIEGFVQGELPPHAAEISAMVRGGLARIQQIVREENADCRLDMYYQLVPSEKRKDPNPLSPFIGRYKAEELREVTDPARRIGFATVGAIVETNAIGQVNGPELQKAVIAAIRRMGGEIIEGSHYQSQRRTAEGYEIESGQGVLRTATEPLLATGPGHLSKRQDLPVPITPVWCVAMHVQLTPEDAKLVSDRPTAFYVADKDYLWGALDNKRVLTMGNGETENPADRPKLERDLLQAFHELLPQLGHRYDDKISFSFNAQAYTPNSMPLVGRLDGFDILTGNCGRAFTQVFGQGRAYAEYVVLGDDTKLRMWESLNVGAPALRPGMAATPVPHAPKP